MVFVFLNPCLRSRLRLRANEAGGHGSVQGRVAGAEPRAGAVSPEHGEHPPFAQVLDRVQSRE